MDRALGVWQFLFISRVNASLICCTAVSWGITGASGRTCTIASREYYSSNSFKCQWLGRTLAALVREGHLSRTRLALMPHNFRFAVGNTDEELCNRWMQLAAFTPFFRNHNIRGAIPQEPYRWDSVAHATRAATAVRYALLPYWVRLSITVWLLTIPFY